VTRGRTHLTFASLAIPLTLVVALLVWFARSDQTPGRPGSRAFQPPAGDTWPAVEPVTFDTNGLALPKKLGSLRFAVMGDVGRGDVAQYDTAAEMARWRNQFDFSFVLMLGDNMYAAGTPEDYVARFERPYKPLLDAGVTFHAANGNHDPASILTYPPYHMNGNRYYTFSRTEGPLGPVAARTVRFFAVDTVMLDNDQLTWLRRELGRSDDDWEICFFHHPLYTSGRYSLAAARLRAVLEPVLVQYGADIALAGHEHFYERLIPQRGILYFTSGAGGALRVNDIRPSRLTAAGFDTDTHFILMEISGDDLYFQAISRTGKTIDAGHVKRIDHATPPPSIRR
jgi:hypothetical protein